MCPDAESNAKYQHWVNQLCQVDDTCLLAINRRRIRTCVHMLNYWNTEIACEHAMCTNAHYVAYNLRIFLSAPALVLTSCVMKPEIFVAVLLIVIQFYSRNPSFHPASCVRTVSCVLQHSRGVEFSEQLHRLFHHCQRQSTTYKKRMWWSHERGLMEVGT